jgi:hypothetical protein
MKRKTETEQLFSNLISIQKRISHLLASVYDSQDWQPYPKQWSFRYIAAHMATVEKECYMDRVIRIAAGERPHFESYFNTGRDFSQLDLRDSLSEWAVTRQVIIDLLSSLSDERWSLVGTHAAYGTITLSNVLQMMFEHDQEHYSGLQQMIEKYRSKAQV